MTSRFLFQPLTHANLEITVSPFRVVNRDYGDIYFSTEDGVAESVHHYIDGNDLPQRFSCATQAHFTVAELGFGTGLNAFLTTRAFLQHRTASCKKLYYIATELNPISRTDLANIYAQWSHLAGFAEFRDTLLAHYPPALTGVHHIVLNEHVELILLWGDSLTRLQRVKASHLSAVDAWYLDGFAPSKNPEQWTLPLCREIARLSHIGTTLSAFSCARVVKDALQDVGVTIGKRKGFGRKRDMLVGQFEQLPEATPPDLVLQPQWAVQSPRPRAKRIVIVGAGLAGAATAHVFAELGADVTVLGDKTNVSDVLPSGALHLHLSTAENAKRDIDLTAYRLAIQAYQALDSQFSRGLLEFDRESRQTQLSELPCSQGVLHLDEETGATRYSQAGAIRPANVTKAWLSNVDVRTGHAVQSVDFAQKTLKVVSKSTQTTVDLEYDAVIFCTGASTAQFFPWLAQVSKPIRGQLSEFQTRLNLPDEVLCHNTLQVDFPDMPNRYFAGGTYDLHDPRAVIKPEDDVQNLDSVVKHNPKHESDTLVSAWAGLRMTSNDTLPFIGPVPDIPRYIDAYPHLKHHATRPVAHPAGELDGVFVNTGFGSKGTIYAPLSARVLAHYVLGTPAPLPATHLANLHLGRFVIRHLQRRTVEQLFDAPSD